MKYYGVCLVDGTVVFLGEFDDPDEAGGVAYNLPGMFSFTPVSENDLLKCMLNASIAINAT